MIGPGMVPDEEIPSFLPSLVEEPPPHSRVGGTTLGIEPFGAVVEEERTGPGRHGR